MTAAQRLSSRANPMLVALRRLARDAAAYRRGGEVWLEGEHLCAAAAAHGVPVRQALLSESGWAQASLRALAPHAARVAIVPDALFAELSALESPAAIGFVMPLPKAPSPEPGLPTVVLDRLQDAGNVGSILRSAAALGVAQVLALKGTAALWSAKVLRAGMGAHFALRLAEGLSEDEILALALPLVGTSPHAHALLPRAALPRPAAWLVGHEGQGASARLLAACTTTVRIPQPGGQESLNVAAAAAICFYETLRRHG
ncbi:MAG: rRNA methyltransferase [Rubrivivax sp. SCN 71-131]|jgi:TrmH family RNA methyltransferase|nr:MAG: rRNA methyltransferase [Rubrivivax sp. SCN 71-131]